MRLLLSFVRQYPSRCLIVFGALLLAGLAEGIGLSTLLPLLTTATEQADGGGAAARMLETGLDAIAVEPTLLSMMLIVVICLLLRAALMLVAYRHVGYTVAYIATDLRLAMLRALSGSRWEYFLRQRAGGLANAVATEATRSAEAFQRGANVVALATQAAIFLGVALLIDGTAALLALMVGVLSFILLRAMVRMARRAGVRQQRLYRSLLARLTDSLRVIKPLKSMARGGELERLLANDTRKLNRALRREVLSREALKVAQELLIGLALIGGIYASQLYWQIPLAAVLVLTLVLLRMLSKLSKIQQEYQKLAVNESFYWSLQAAINDAQAQAERAFGDRAPSLDAGVGLSGLRFSYGGMRVLDGLDMQIPAGCLTALVGASGAGKTTIVDLIVGLLRAPAGEIRIDGVLIDDIDIGAWRRLIGYVPQDTVLLNDTILANVAVGAGGISEADVAWALEKAGAWAFVEQLPEGVHTELGELQSRLSGGQRQRIVIARALAHRPKLLILDEATSALDPDTERAVSHALAGLRGECTILAISHRPTLMAAADRVYRIEDGRAVRIDGSGDPLAHSA